LPALEPALRRQLENTIVAARDAAEKAADAAIKSLAVHEKEPYSSFSDEQKRLRRALRAKCRQLGSRPEDDLTPLVEECAYGQWHRMLFARFLAENGLLMHPEGVPVTLEECAELAPEEGDADGWAAAARYATGMLPGIFNPGGASTAGNQDPALEVRLAPEGRRALERRLEEIPPPAFTADDGLGWVYQFWQTKAKKEVNASGRKISGPDLPAVTQLFTEDYMVRFLLHNTLGAWWAARHPHSPITAGLDYLRYKEDGTPAAGDFPGWPESAAEIQMLDPCCGSGHFLTAAADLLRRMRAEEEDLSGAEAAEAVLRDNVHGLELDARCTQIAAFSLALQAWRHGGYRPLPVPDVACSGIPAGGREEEWTRLAGDDYRLETTLSRLHKLFTNAPDLGSLIDPARVSENLTLETADFEETEALLEKALARERGDDPAAAVFGEAARGLARAASLLRGRYHLVATNVPYLARGKQGDVLKDHLDQYHTAGKADLATAFVQRCGGFCAPGGSYALVTPQNWLFLGTYKKLRERLLKQQSWDLVARLGAGAFETIGGEVVNVALIALTNTPPAPDHPMSGLDVSQHRSPAEKADALQGEELSVLEQAGQLENPDAIISLNESSQFPLLSQYAESLQGISPADSARYVMQFWEFSKILERWQLCQSSPDGRDMFRGREFAARMDQIWRASDGGGAYIRGEKAWGKNGISFGLMRDLPFTIYTGQVFVANNAVLIPKNSDHLPAILAYCNAGEFSDEVRRINQKVSVDNGYLTKVPFDLERWQRVADEEYADGLPEPYSDDPTQWLFHGHPAPSEAPLQVAVARLLGYRWPAETDPEMELSEEARGWIPRSAGLLSHADTDGLVCLPPVAGERPAAERLRALLADAYGDEFSPALLDRLLADVEYPGKDLATWLRDGFFKQHARLFHNRPFVWHVTDGRKDGFSALVNYHALDRAKLERLIYTYLGSYIEGQQSAARSGEPQADARLAAARELKTSLEAILQGDPPHDIYVRWKPRREQPIGWEPDINDGVRLNMRPFVETGVLRAKFTINWKKDRGKNPDGTERHNDLHLTRVEKEEARRDVGDRRG
jgi:hypothetical protein